MNYSFLLKTLKDESVSGNDSPDVGILSQTNESKASHMDTMAFSNLYFQVRMLHIFDIYLWTCIIIIMKVNRLATNDYVFHTIFLEDDGI